MSGFYGEEGHFVTPDMRTVPNSRFTDEVGCEAADVLAVEDVEHPQLLECLLAEPAHWDVYQLFVVFLGEPSPACSGWGFAQERDVPFAGMAAGGGE